MPQWILDSMQYLQLALFATASISVEWRRPGLILSGFALLYLTMALPLFGGVSFNWIIREADSPMFMLMWVLLDMAGAFLIFEYCRPSKQNTKFLNKHWLGLSGVLIAFWVAHYLNFCYTMGYAVASPTPIYNWIVVGLVLFTSIIALPGAKEGAYEIKELVNQKLAGVHYFGGGHTSAPVASPHRRPERGKEPGDRRRNPGSGPDILVDHSRHVHTGRGKT